MGVTSAARRSVRPVPLVIDRADGCHLFDVDGHEFIDYSMGFGPLLLGHTPADVQVAVRKQLERGTTYGAQSRLELTLAQSVRSALSYVDSIIFSNTGSEAVHIALRLARAHTRRDLVVKFEGHYHGWLDNVLYCTPGQVPSSDRDLAPFLPLTPACTGIAAEDAQLLVLPWNDVRALESAFRSHGSRIAAVIMEPTPQAGLFKPLPDYLEAARRITREYGSVLIFDEVVTGFRIARGGAAERFGVHPDLAVLGKALGAGFPVAAVCGHADILRHVADGTVAHMGTFNGHPVFFAAAIAALERYVTPGFYRHLEKQSTNLAYGLEEALASASLPLKVHQIGGLVHLLGLPQTAQPVRYGDLAAADSSLVGRYAEELLRHGIYIQARGTFMVSAAHSDEDIARTIVAAHAAASALR